MWLIALLLLGLLAIVVLKFVAMYLLSRPVSGPAALVEVRETVLDDMLELDPCGVSTGGLTVYKVVADQVEERLNEKRPLSAGEARRCLESWLVSAGCPEPSPLLLRRLARRVVHRFKMHSLRG